MTDNAYLDRDAIAAAAVPIFRARDDLARRLAQADTMIANLGKSYARVEGLPFVRPEAFRRQVRA